MTAIEIYKIVQFDTMLGAEITAERHRQDTQWGGPDHDDSHCLEEWPSFMARFLDRARNEALDQGLSPGTTHAVKFEKAMISIAALAVAAVQSSRRQRNGR